MSAPVTLRKTAETRHLAIAAARYLALGWTQRRIAVELHLNEPYVARLIAAAESWGYVSRLPTMLRHQINAEDWEAVQERYFRDLTFTPVLAGEVPAGIHFEALAVPGDYLTFLRGAADQIAHRLRHTGLLGTMWGRTVFLIAQHIQVLSDTLNRDLLRRIECIPLCGDPIFLMNQRRLEYSASWLAATLQKALAPNFRGSFPCLHGVPAYVSRAVRAASTGGRPAWRQLFEELPGYEMIFSSRSRLIAHVDSIITGAGIVVPGLETLEHATGDLIEERLQQEKDLTKEKLDQIIWGDIGGWLLEKPGLKPADKKLVDDLNRGWTGATLEHLSWVAKAAVPGQRVGVILVARGTPKAELILEIVRRGLVNTLLIDEELARYLKTMVQPAGRPGPKPSR